MVEVETRYCMDVDENYPLVTAITLPKKLRGGLATAANILIYAIRNATTQPNWAMTPGARGRQIICDRK